MNNFVIENGTLLQYKGKSLDIIIPDEVTTINSDAIKESKRIILNNNCRKICKHAIGTIAGLKGSNYSIDEIIVSKDSKLKIVEEYAFPKTSIPISLPDGIKVLNASRASLKYIPPKTQHIKIHAIANHNDILYLPESVLKIDEFGLGTKNVFLTKKTYQTEWLDIIWLWTW